MDIKYNISKFKNSKIEEAKDSVSIEEPLEMRLKYKIDDKWQTQNLSITMRTPGNDEDLVRGFLYNERIIENINQIENIEMQGDDVGDYNLKNIIEATINNIPVVIARSGWSGEVGYEIYLMDGEKGNKLWEIIMQAGAEFNIAPAAPSQISRIESGMLSYGNDMTLDENPFDLNMEKFVNLQKKLDS